MITIDVNEEHIKFINKYAEYQTIGGFSNLSKSDLSKASRLNFQKTGVAGELAFYLYRYNSYKKLESILDSKFKNLRPAGKGDGGFDDSLTFNNKTRLIDIKSSHVEDEKKIQYLNLIIPEREFHTNLIYVAAFVVGPNRENPKKVILVGWAINEDVHKRWKYDPNKYCVPVSDLRDMRELEQYIRNV